MIKNPKCEYCENPIGIDTPRPYYSWKKKNNIGKNIKIKIKLPGKTKGAMKYGDGALVIHNGTEAFIIDPVTKSITWGVQ
jgi:hypothetical protein